MKGNTDTLAAQTAINSMSVNSTTSPLVDGLGHHIYNPVRWDWRGNSPWNPPRISVQALNQRDKTVDPSKIGVYLEPREGKLVRITSPYWIPEPPTWLMISNDPNVTLLAARAIIGERGLMEDPNQATWSRIPKQD